MLRGLVVASVALALVTAALAPVAQAQSRSAPVQLGIFGNLGRIEALTGQQTQVGHVIVGWGQTTFDQIWPTLGPVPMLGLRHRARRRRVDHTARRSPAAAATTSCSR